MKWIKVSDRLPEGEDPKGLYTYWVWINHNGTQFPDCLLFIDPKWIKVGIGTNSEIDDVTHWADIEPPKD